MDDKQAFQCCKPQERFAWNRHAFLPLTRPARRANFREDDHGRDSDRDRARASLNLSVSHCPTIDAHCPFGSSKVPSSTPFVMSPCLAVNSTSTRRRWVDPYFRGWPCSLALSLLRSRLMPSPPSFPAVASHGGNCWRGSLALARPLSLSLSFLALLILPSPPLPPPPPLFRAHKTRRKEGRGRRGRRDADCQPASQPAFLP